MLSTDLFAYRLIEKMREGWKKRSEGKNDVVYKKSNEFFIYTCAPNILSVFIEFDYFNVS